MDRVEQQQKLEERLRAEVDDELQVQRQELREAIEQEAAEHDMELTDNEGDGGALAQTAA